MGSQSPHYSQVPEGLTEFGMGNAECGIKTTPTSALPIPHSNVPEGLWAKNSGR